MSKSEPVILLLVLAPALAWGRSGPNALGQLKDAASRRPEVSASPDAIAASGRVWADGNPASSAGLGAPAVDVQPEREFSTNGAYPGAPRVPPPSRHAAAAPPPRNAERRRAIWAWTAAIPAAGAAGYGGAVLGAALGGLAGGIVGAVVLGMVGLFLGSLLGRAINYLLNGGEEF